MTKVISNAEQFVALLNEHKEPIEAVITTRTLVTMRKKDIATKTIENPYAEVWKVQTRKVILNPKYEAAVNEQRAAEGNTEEFKAKQMKWGIPVGTAATLKDGALCLKMIQESDETPFYAVRQVGNDMDVSHVIAFDAIKPFTPLPAPSKNQGVKDNVVFICPKMENILHIQTAIGQFV